MRVIGTAGHVDHGKSTLVAALTGMHPDRLKEEQEREMTIDLGFAWLALPDGETVGIVDVPGHRDFIENMLSGIGGIDAALFVVAADEGVMPQTREHLAILDILQIDGGVVALTKTDLTPDPDWLELVQMDVRQALQGTVLADAPIVPVSARSGAGLPELIAALQACLAQRPPRPDLGRPRLPVDRVFTIAGFGTVVTGTLIDGQLKLGEDVELQPSGLRGRIRGLQTHKKKEQTAVQGSRTAVNITGIDVSEIHRGEVLAHPGAYRAARMLDVQFQLLKDASAPLRHGAEVKFFTGSAEVQAHVRMLGTDELKPGEEGWLQLELRSPVVALRGDRYILRRPSPSETLGGGMVIDPQPKRHRRFDPDTLTRLQSLLRGSPAEVLASAFQALGIATLKDAVARSRLGPQPAAQALTELVQNGELRLIEAGDAHPQADLLAALSAAWQKESERARAALESYHRANPLRRGMPREELKSRLKMAARPFNAALRQWSREGLLEEQGVLVNLPGHVIHFNPQQRAAMEHLLARFAAAPYAPPSVKEAQAEVGEEVYQAMLDQGTLVQVAPDVVFRKPDYEEMLRQVREHFAREATLTAAQFRDRFQTSRKYALGFLEHLDAAGMTVREGDYRRWKK